MTVADETLIVVVRIAAGALVGGIGVWQARGNELIAWVALGVSAFIVVGHC